MNNRMHSPHEKDVVVTFSVKTDKDPAASKKAGRPIYKETEMITYQMPGNKLSVPVFPAHSFAGWMVDEEGNQVSYTHAMKYSEQYRRFKEGRQQTHPGTPLAELPFLSQAKRLELKALAIYTVEQLAGLDGQNLKTLGHGGRELKNQAMAFIEKATGGAAVARLAADNASLKEQLALMAADMAAMKAQMTPPPVDPTLAALDYASLKEKFKQLTGNAVRGTPSREALLRMVQEVASGKAETKQPAESEAA